MGDIIQIIGVSASAIGGLIIVSAIARRIAGPYSRHSTGRPDRPAIEELRDEVAQLRNEVAELRERGAELDDMQNRLDFAERLLSQGKDRS